MVLLHAGIKNAGRKVEGRLLQFGKHSTSETTVRPSNTAIKKSDLGSEEICARFMNLKITPYS